MLKFLFSNLGRVGVEPNFTDRSRCVRFTTTSRFCFYCFIEGEGRRAVSIFLFLRFCTFIEGTSRTFFRRWVQAVTVALSYGERQHPFVCTVRIFGGIVWVLQGL